MVQKSGKITARKECRYKTSVTDFNYQPQLFFPPDFGTSTSMFVFFLKLNDDYWSVEHLLLLEGLAIFFVCVLEC